MMQPPVKRGPGRPKFEAFWCYLASFKEFTLIISYAGGLQFSRFLLTYNNYYTLESLSPFKFYNYATVSQVSG